MECFHDLTNFNHNNLKVTFSSTEDKDTFTGFIKIDVKPMINEGNNRQSEADEYGKRYRDIFIKKLEMPAGFLIDKQDLRSNTPNNIDSDFREYAISLDKDISQERVAIGGQFSLRQGMLILPEARVETLNNVLNDAFKKAHNATIVELGEPEVHDLHGTPVGVPQSLIAQSTVTERSNVRTKR